MKIRSIYSKITSLAGCLAAAVCMAACTGDKTGAGSPDEALEIRLKALSDGVATRVGEGNTPLYLKAYNTGDLAQEYFPQTVMRIATGLSGTAQDLVLTPARYYPLGDNPISLFAYNSPLTPDDRMILTAGVDDDENDFVLSNYGQRRTASGTVDTPEGEGTTGTSKEPAELLQFRHVMTQLTVKVEVDKSQSNFVDPEPETVEFTIAGMHSKGYYPLTAVTPDPSSGSVTSADYDTSSEVHTVELGVNYLVPSGLDLVGKTFSSLVIDDYKATDADLAEFVITGDDPAMPLYPGYAYTLTLKIQKLRLVGVVLTQVPWVEKSVGGENPTYDPYNLTLNIEGGYTNTGTDRITKVVLHTNERRQYVGEVNATTDELEFVTLPADGVVDSVDLFTSRGLLLSMPVPASDYASNTLSFNLSKVGMLLEDPDVPNSETNPYLVTTLAQFLNIEYDLGGYYRQENDLEFDDLDVTGLAPQFGGFGTFTGVYDGNSYWLGNMNITCPALFAANTGKLLNIRIYGGNMDMTGPYSGSICAVNSGLIYACVNEASLFGATGTVGGICGLNQAGGRVIACVNTGNVREGTVLGGICGENRNAAADAIVACLSIGNVHNAGNVTAGAIIGKSTDSAAAVIDTSFWLAGSVETSPGQTEIAVGSGTVGMNDVAGLEKDRMRDGVGEGEDPLTDNILTKLNSALAADADYDPAFRYYLDYKLTGITWPMPYNVNNIN